MILILKILLIKKKLACENYTGENLQCFRPNFEFNPSFLALTKVILSETDLDYLFGYYIKIFYLKGKFKLYDTSCKNAVKAFLLSSN